MTVASKIKVYRISKYNVIITQYTHIYNGLCPAVDAAVYDDEV